MFNIDEFTTRQFDLFNDESSRQPSLQAGLIKTSIGCCLVAFSEHGLYWLEPDPDESSIEKLQVQGEVQRLGDAETEQLMADFLVADKPQLHLQGSDFQLSVWSALADVSHGTTVAYGELAEKLGAPMAARAVGSAVGANKLALVVPCHRVLPAGGGLGGFRWGEALKAELLRLEHSEPPQKAVSA